MGFLDDKQLLGKTFSCECGKNHSIEPDDAVYADDAVEQMHCCLAKYVEGKRIAALMDRRTEEAAGNAVVECLLREGWEVCRIIVPDPAEGESPVCDDITKESLKPELDGARAIVSVGSGVISDLGKWLAFEIDAPFFPFATAASMNGYASANVAPTIDGLKTLVRARAPKVVFSTPAVLQNAPYNMTASGLGDILAKSVSSADWYLNHYLFGDYYCERSVNLISDIEPLYLENPQLIAERDPEAIQALFKALLLTGVAMTMAETSSPSSGGEHLISHSLDMLSTLDGHEHDLHGRQVGLGTILTSEIYRRVLEIESPQLQNPVKTVDDEFWGHLAPVVKSDYTKKIERLKIAREKLKDGETWQHLRTHLSGMTRSPELIRHCLRTAGAACRAEDIGCTKEKFHQVLLHAHEMRSRFTILDLAQLMGIMPKAAEEIIEHWA